MVFRKTTTVGRALHRLQTTFGAIRHRLCRVITTSGLRFRSPTRGSTTRSLIVISRNTYIGRQKFNATPLYAKKGLHRALPAEPEVEIWWKQVQSVFRPWFPIRPQYFRGSICDLRCKKLETYWSWRGDGWETCRHAGRLSRCRRNIRRLASSPEGRHGMRRRASADTKHRRWAVSSAVIRAARTAKWVELSATPKGTVRW